MGALEEVARHHNAAQSTTTTRLDGLEREVEALRSQGPSPVGRGRSSTPVRGGGRDLSPIAAWSPRDLESELQIVVGGWRDARKADAEQEVCALLAGYAEVLLES